MKYLITYQKFFESSQFKKLKKYFTYSVVLDWYKNNKEKIANILKCNVNELASEDTLMQQSYGLVNSVINTQTRGNSGRDDFEIAGFSNFKKIENNLIHDILHNLYDVNKKSFNKSLSDLEFSESEIMEEMEVLGIEESFMKYMNIRYVKTDFINQNINLLASYLIMVILKNDPSRIKDILDGKIKPYLEVYGKKYEIENTPFENLFMLFKNDNADSSFKIRNSNDLKNYMIKLINVGIGISDSGGDRAQYPNYSYYGLETWTSITDKEREDTLEYLEDTNRFYIISSDNNEMDVREFKFNYTLIGKNTIISKETKPEDEQAKRQIIDNNLNKIALQCDFVNDYKSNKYASLLLFPDEINYNTNEIYVVYTNKETEKEIKGYISIDNIPNYLTPQLKLESVSYKMSSDNFKDKNNLESIPINRKSIIDGEINIDIWFEYLNDLYDEDIYVEINNKKFIGIKYSNGSYQILNSEDLEDKARQCFEESADSISNNHQFINIEAYKKKSFEEIAKIMMRSSDAVAIMRRNFRANDAIKNNTKLGKNDYNNTEVKTKNPIHNYIDFGASDFSAEQSLSKNILTDNGKKLTELLNNLRGYFINNIKKVKNNYDKKSAKFNKENIEQYKKIDIDALKKILDNISTVDFSEPLKIEFSITDYTYSGDIILPQLNNKLNSIQNFDDVFGDYIKFKKLIATKSDIDFLKNYVNDRGNLQTTKDITVFKKLVNKISKYEDIIKNYKYTEVIKNLICHDVDRNKYNITKIINLYKKGEYEETVKSLKEILNDYYDLDIKEINVSSCKTFEIKFIVELN